MSVDEALLATPGPPTLRLYSWSSEALSLGWFQRVADFAPLLQLHPLLTVVRRVTGGGAIHHQPGEITFALVVEASLLPASVPESYRRIHDAVIAALASLAFAARYPGPALCFATTSPLDLVDPAGRKVLGSAQRRSRGRVLHQACLPLRPPGLTPATASIPCARDELEPRLVTAIAAALDLVPEPGALTAEEAAGAARLLTRRRSDPSFAPRR